MARLSRGAARRSMRLIEEPLRSVIELDGRAGAVTFKKLLPEEPDKFSNPKPVELMTLLIEFAGDSDALVLDPFAGSATTAHAVMRLNAKDTGNRRYIMIEEGHLPQVEWPGGQHGDEGSARGDVRGGQGAWSEPSAARYGSTCMVAETDSFRFCQITRRNPCCAPSS